MIKMLTPRGELALWLLSIGACLVAAAAFWAGFRHGQNDVRRAQLEGREPIPELQLQDVTNPRPR